MESIETESMLLEVALRFAKVLHDKNIRFRLVVSNLPSRSGDRIKQEVRAEFSADAAGACRSVVFYKSVRQTAEIRLDIGEGHHTCCRVSALDADYGKIAEWLGDERELTL